MPRGKKFTAEQIIGKLREAEVELSRGKAVAEAFRKIGVTEQTYYRWKKAYGGLRMDQAKRLKELEKKRTLVSNASWLTRTWIKRFFERPPRETSEPGEAAACGGPCA